MADTIAVRFRLNGEPATGLTLASIDIYLTAIAKSNGAATAIWNPENPTAEVSGLGVYIRQATLDFQANYYLLEYDYTGTSTDVDDVRGWGELGGDPLAEAAIADIAALQTSVNTIDDFLDTEVAAILEDTGTTIPAQITALNNLSAQQVWEYATRTLSAFGFSVTVGTVSDKTGYSLSVAGIQAIVDDIMAEVLESGKTFKTAMLDLWAVIVGDGVADDADEPTQIEYDSPDGTVQVTHTLTDTTRSQS